MKIVLLTALMLSCSAFAKTGVSGENLIQSVLQGRSAATLSGSTSDGQPCALAIRKVTEGAYNLVVVKLPSSLRSPKIKSARSFSEDFVGVNSADAQEEVSGPRVRYASARSWGNSSKRNSVEIETRNGVAVFATGVSDVQHISCRLSESARHD